MTKILYRPSITISGETCALLLPLPANPDELFRQAGISDFAEVDDEWEREFDAMVGLLIDGDEYAMHLVNGDATKKIPLTRERHTDILVILAEQDALKLVVSFPRTSGRRMEFINGQQALWLFGFTDGEIRKAHPRVAMTDDRRLDSLY